MSAAVPVSRPRPLLRWSLTATAGAAFLPIVAAGLVIGLAAHAVRNAAAGDAAWRLATGLAALVLGVAIARDLVARRIGVDVIALLAMLGAIGLGEYLADAPIRAASTRAAAFLASASVV